MPTLNFLLTGEDGLSPVLNNAGSNADDLARRLDDAARNGNASMARFTRDADGRLRDLRGRFISVADAQRMLGDGMPDLTVRVGENASAMEELVKVTAMLWPAAIPAAASLAPIAAGAGTVAIALGVMGAAMGPQIAALSEVSDAQEKYQDAVAESGERSEEAVKAQAAYAQAMAKLPPETRRAAAAVGVLKDSYKEWSDSLAGDTMAPFTKGVAIVNALLPKTRELVKGTSAQADRFMTILGGTINSPGLDALNSKFTNFAQRTLRSVNDELVHLLRVGQGGEIGGNAREFMTWARAQGPTVASVLTSVSTALLHVLQAGSEVGVGLLQAIEVIARLVSAVPPEAIGLFLQLALALKLTKAAAIAMAATSGGVAAFTASIAGMQAAAAGATGVLPKVAAAIGALSRTAKIAIAGTGIGLLLIALSELSQRGRQAPPDVDRLTSSLRELGNTGKVTGEAARHFGSDLDGMYDKVRSLTDPGTLDKVQQFLVGWSGWDSTPVKEAKENLDSVDKALANLVQGGQSDLAAAALQRLTAEYGKGGRDTRQFTKELDDYRSAVADAKFEQQLAAQSMGLFGAQAQKVQAQLDAQKRSTDGLRQSIKALNDVNRQGLGGMIGFEAAIDAASKAAQENGAVLSMTGGQLNLSGEKARSAATALQDLASKTDEAAASARESGSSWETVNGIYSRGRAALIKNAQAMGLSRSEAAQLADQILKIPDKTAKVRMNKEDAERDLNAFNAAVKRSPGSKSVTLKTLSKAAEQILESFGLKVKRLPNGSITVTARTGAALSGVRNVKGAVDSLRSKSITITTVKQTVFTTKGTSSRVAPAHRGYADGGTPRAGEVAMVGEEGPELVVFGQAARVFDAKTTASILRGSAGAGHAASQGLAAGLGSTRGVYTASRVMAGAVTAGIRDELEIRSPSKKTKALAWDVAHGFLEGLTRSRDKIKSTAADLVKDIRTAFSGRKESGLVRMVNQQSKKLMDLAAKRDAVAKKIAEAKQFRDTVMNTARSGATLGNLGIEEGAVTAGGIRGAMGDKLAKIKQFTSFVKSLASRGLHKTLLRQILEMGPEAGYAYANALAGADKGTLTSINKTQYGLDVATRQLGEIGADRLYDSGKNAGKGFLKGLESQEKSIEALMMRIAKSMQKSIKKALGIKSPSTVMAKLGEFSTEGLARGLVDGMPALDRSLAAVSGRVSGIQPVIGRPAVGGRAAGGAPIHIHVDGAVVDTLGFARAARESLLELKRALGGGELGIA